jgi:hypothetical protein
LEVIAPGEGFIAKREHAARYQGNAMKSNCASRARRSPAPSVPNRRA